MCASGSIKKTAAKNLKKADLERERKRKENSLGKKKGEIGEESQSRR